jgi:hypothetical protein
MCVENVCARDAWRLQVGIRPDYEVACSQEEDVKCIPKEAFAKPEPALAGS